MVAISTLDASWMPASAVSVGALASGDGYQPRWRVDSRPVPPDPEVEREKQAAAEAAAALVEDGMTVGLGTGSTVAHLLPSLAARGLDIRCIATSPATELAARELGLRVEAFDRLARLDIAIDGADQVAPDGWLV